MDSATATTDKRQSSSRRQQKQAGPPGKPSKACVPCRARKVKCDAALRGLPCSGCVSRQCPESCVLSARKRRKRAESSLASPRKGESLIQRGDVYVLSSPPDYATDSGQSTHAEDLGSEKLDEAACAERFSHCHHISDPLSCQLHYLNVLKDAVHDTASNQQHGGPINASNPRQEDNLTSQIRILSKLPQLDDSYKEFLTKKGVFDLPPQRYLDVLIKTYFAYVYPFAPVIDRIDFIRNYRAGNYSLFLLYAMLATATLHAPPDVISGCGFEDRSTAQASFSGKATLLHDFHFETDLLPMLQGSLILGVVILDHSTDKDYHYWFYNSTRLAVKLDIHKISMRDDKSSRLSKLYRRIWLLLYCRDSFFHLLSGTRTLQLIGNDPQMRPITKNDWELEEIPVDFQSLLLPISNRQKCSFSLHCELAQIFGRLLSAITNDQEKDPRQLIRPLDAWRMSLAEKMQIRDQSSDGDMYYAELRGSSYRFEFVICRLIRRRWQSRDAERCEWAKQRLRSAIFELDAIAGRMLANGTIQDFPVSFITAMPTLLALHIESALDTSETDLVRSMSRISISQMMLVLGELKEIPVIKRAIPIFEMVLSKKSLSSAPHATVEQHMPQTPADECTRNESNDQSRMQSGVLSFQDAQEEYTSFLGEFMDFDVLDRWELGQLDFPGTF
ncbi:hypothetical protein BGZ61DRAFT_440039 [Ilyonectria robusta]|uniref:uncharacterized protein n=1 Tax=Ilyonectria robusta TaxID=1079257 RepID=UPI001E8CB1C4|nr:uncharacterized protein BGZ61DRAFT_440039 [Ilyonectria robusta]KAH8738441.1 hypothetical protein BGZ61DRAFT_440039 [Ilyonectria robusta]